jgi:hypothetical protein
VKNEVDGNSVATVVLRGSTDSILDDLERAVDDGVNTYKVLPPSLIEHLFVPYYTTLCEKSTLNVFIYKEYLIHKLYTLITLLIFLICVKNVK